jgi:hypothetical protein
MTRRGGKGSQPGRQAQSEKRGTDKFFFVVDCGTDKVTCVKHTKPGGPSAQLKPRPVPLAHQEWWPTGQRLRASLSEPLPPSVTPNGSWHWQLRTRQNRVENRIRPTLRESDLRRATRPPHRVVLLLALATPSGSFGRPRYAPAGGRDGAVRPAAPDGPHAVREDVLRAAHHARRELAPRRHLPRRARPTPVQGRECPSLSLAAPCYLTASGLLARIYVNPASSRGLSPPGPARARHALRSAGSSSRPW